MKAIRVLVVLVLLLLTLFPIIARADERGNKLWNTLKPDFIALNVFLGEQMKNKHWRAKDWDYKIYGANIGLGYYLNKKKKWRLRVNAIYRHYLAHNESNEIEADTFGLGLAVERSFEMTKEVSIFIGINGDLSYLSDCENQPHWKDS